MQPAGKPDIDTAVSASILPPGRTAAQLANNAGSAAAPASAARPAGRHRDRPAAQCPGTSACSVVEGEEARPASSWRDPARHAGSSPRACSTPADVQPAAPIFNPSTHSPQHNSLSRCCFNPGHRQQTPTNVSVGSCRFQAPATLALAPYPPIRCQAHGIVQHPSGMKHPFKRIGTDPVSANNAASASRSATSQETTNHRFTSLATGPRLLPPCRPAHRFG